MSFEDFEDWGDVRLLDRYEHLLVCNLYSSTDELEAIGRECIRRYGFHPNHWRTKGIVPSSWTDTYGITHDWRHFAVRRRLDDPIRTVTCFQCVIR